MEHFALALQNLAPLPHEWGAGVVVICRPQPRLADPERSADQAGHVGLRLGRQTWRQRDTVVQLSCLH